MGLFRDDRNTARPTRARFEYQDEVVALRCITNLVSGEVRSVIVEWSTDYIAVLADGDPEVISVKHRDPGTGDWVPSALRPVLTDLHMVWREMKERCRCAFASSSGITAGAAKAIRESLPEILGIGADEAARFGSVLAMPDPPLPRRHEITAVGVRDMTGALSLMNLDVRYAEDCYRALVASIEAVATERPDSPEQRIARLTGTLREVNDRRRPRLHEQTLQIADLRDLVTATHGDCVRATPHIITALRPAAGRDRDDGRWHGGSEVVADGRRYLVHEPVEMIDASDGSYREQRARGRSLDREPVDVRLVQLDIRRPGQRRNQLEAEADLYRRFAELPELLADDSGPDKVTMVSATPEGTPLPLLYGPPPYAGIGLDGLLRGLPALGRDIGALHAAGFAHRALRPEALIGCPGGVRLRDVGLAAAPPAVGEGPAEYRSPEQERPIVSRPGPATDVYQIAAVVYHLATGQTVGNRPVPPSFLRPELVPGLDAPLLAALAADPADRPTLDRLLESLTEVLRAGGTVTC
jgi:hypothetical protein